MRPCWNTDLLQRQEGDIERHLHRVAGSGTGSRQHHELSQRRCWHFDCCGYADQPRG